MMKRSISLTLTICFSLLVTIEVKADEPISPIPRVIHLNKEKVALGKKLFHDTRLSINDQISCASCHKLDQGGTDQLPFSFGVSGKASTVNTPTVYNLHSHFLFFWDGRAASLEEQIDGPVHHPDEMGSNWASVVEKLSKVAEYKKEFSSIYDDPISESSIKDAIAEYERSLITPDAPFDLFLRGQENAISEQAKQGYQYFKDFGCASCHQGKNIGGNMFQTFGVVGDYFKDRGTPITKADLGRYNVTKQEWDRHVFKVPSLRNIALTKPYFHDGSAATLEDAVDIMARYQLGKELSSEEKNALVAFLVSLTGKQEGEIQHAE